MFRFVLRDCPVYLAIRNESRFSEFKVLSKICLFLFFLSAIIFALAYLENGTTPLNFLRGAKEEILGLVFIFGSLFSSFWYAGLFFETKLKKPAKTLDVSKALKEKEYQNIAAFLDFETAKAMYSAGEFSSSKNIELTPLAFFFFLAKTHPGINFIFPRLNLDKEEVLRRAEQEIGNSQKPRSKEKEYSEEFFLFIADFLERAQKAGRKVIDLGDVFVSLAEYEPSFKKLLVEVDITAEELEKMCLWYRGLKENEARSKIFWEKENLLKYGSLGRDFAAGYTVTLDRFSIDWTDQVCANPHKRIFGHIGEIEAIERILARTETNNNVLVVGEPGSGRKSVIFALAQKAFLGTSLAGVNFKKFVELDLTRLVSVLESSEQAEAALEMIFREATLAGNIILIIDDFHNFISQTHGAGIIDVTGIVSSFLRYPQFQLIGITDYVGLHKQIEQKPSLLHLFEKVEVSEISESETTDFLQSLSLSYERKYRRIITFQALREAVRMSGKYIQDIPFPKKAEDVLDEVMVEAAKERGGFLVLPRHVATIITRKTEIPVGETQGEEKEKLLNLEGLLHQRIINQEEAVREVSTALRRSRSEVTVRKGPMGAFLFLGPTGVGKTETAKALSEIYFGSEDKMVRLDMSEFQSLSDIGRLLGAPGQEGLLTTEVRENPFSLVLLDEFEKAHPNILNLFLQVLDEGHLTDGMSRKINFKNTIIIATSNAGYKIILEALKKGGDLSDTKQELLDSLFQEGVFRPELINRFDAVVLFKPLTRQNLLDIAALMLKKLTSNLRQKGIIFAVTPELLKKVVELGYSPVFGAREMRRVIQESVENVLAEALLKDEIKRGDTITMLGDFKIIKH